MLQPTAHDNNAHSGPKYLYIVHIFTLGMSFLFHVCYEGGLEALRKHPRPKVCLGHYLYPKQLLQVRRMGGGGALPSAIAYLFGHQN